MESDSTAQVGLTASGIVKIYPGVRAVDFAAAEALTFHRGEIHALLGENGAGKSTLISIISGNQQADHGEMQLDGAPYRPRSVAEARREGVEVVLQEPGLVREMTIADNLFLGRESLYTKAGLLSHATKLSLARLALERVGENIAANVDVGSLTLEQQKFVELARALSFNPRVLIIDEMTASLTQHGVRRMVALLQNLREQGTCIIYISHYLEEIFEFCDRVTVLKDGRLVRSLDVAATDHDSLSVMMVGRETRSNMYATSTAKPGRDDRLLLSVKNLSLADRYQDISFELRRGEIIGIGGLLGCGSEDLLRSLFGANHPTQGGIAFENEPIILRGPSDAIRRLIAYVPKDREREGLILRSSIQNNIALPSLPWMSRFGFVRDGHLRAITRDLISRLLIACRSPEEPPFNLSGGNRQKIVLAKWMARDQKILMLSNPTRGIDVGAKAEIYTLIRHLADRGLGVILVSDELQELIGMSDHILVMRRGAITARISRDQNPTEEKLISFMI